MIFFQSVDCRIFDPRRRCVPPPGATLADRRERFPPGRCAPPPGATLADRQSRIRCVPEGVSWIAALAVLRA
jgi:hypothetical protein